MNIRKQTVKFAAIAAVALFAGALAANAGEILVGKVPFDFMMGNKSFPAGEYKFEVDRLSTGTVVVRSADASTFAIALSHPAGDSARDGAPVLKFNVYGERRFLSGIQTTNGAAVTVARGTQERAIVKERGETSVAVVSAKRSDARS